MNSGPGGMLARWSQRKLAARLTRHGSAAPVAREGVEAPAGSAADARAEDQAPPTETVQSAVSQTDIESAEAADAARPALPSLDELTADSDYSVFLAKEVPEDLRRAALRKLWTSDPVYACLDGLNDYDEDFNVIDKVISLAETSYKVGRGYLDEIVSETPGAETETHGSSSVESSHSSEFSDAPHAARAGVESPAKAERVQEGDAPTSRTPAEVSRHHVASDNRADDDSGFDPK